MVRLSAFVALLAGELESVTCTVKLLVPLAVGVPVMVPALALKDRLVGKLPALRDQVYGVVPPTAASVAL